MWYIYTSTCKRVIEQLAVMQEVSMLGKVRIYPLGRQEKNTVNFLHLCSYIHVHIYCMYTCTETWATCLCLNKYNCDLVPDKETFSDSYPYLFPFPYFPNCDDFVSWLLPSRSTSISKTNVLHLKYWNFCDQDKQKRKQNIGPCYLVCTRSASGDYTLPVCTFIYMNGAHTGIPNAFPPTVIRKELYARTLIER